MVSPRLLAQFNQSSRIVESVAEKQTTEQQTSPIIKPQTNTKTNTNLKMTTRCQQISPAPLCGPSSLPTASSSSIIPLPKSHIHRTPSELQMADDARRAEYDDVRMYARLVVGMQSQIQRDFVENGGVIHPMSKMALQGVVKTKAANDEELSKLTGNDNNQCGDEQENLQEDDHGGGGGGWGISFIEEDQDDFEINDCSVASPWSTQVLRTPSKSSSDWSLSTHASHRIHGEDEDDCVFSLEL